MDTKFALRSLARSPGFTLLAIAILALGIGANTAIFSVVHSVILRPLGYPDPDRLVSISTVFRNRSNYGQVSGPDFLDWRSQTSAFASMAAYSSGVTSVVTTAGADSYSEFTGVAEISEDFLRALGVQPIQGRAFTREEWIPGKAHAALVSASFWQRHFGDAAFSGGHTVKSWGGASEIVGILPAGFHFPEESGTEIWLPFSENLASTNRGGHNYRVVGRLKRGVTVEQAQVQLSALGERLAKAYPGTNKGTSSFVTPLVNFTVRNVKTSLYVLLAAVALVLAIACANVANLLLARGAGRVRELAIRAALGAGRARIVRQLLVESLLLGAAGCGAGVLLAKAVLPLLVAAAPRFVPRLDQVTVDLQVLLFCAGCGFAASLLFGLAPAFQASRVDPSQGLRGNARGVLGSVTGRLRRVFVTAEVALCMILLVSAGLLLKSFSALTSVDMGFRPNRLLVAELSVPVVSSDRANEVFYKPLLARLSTIPGVQAAALTQTLPGETDTRSDGSYVISGQSLNDMRLGGPEAGFSVVSADYFNAMKIPLAEGRTFSDRDDASALPVAIISEALARRPFARRDPVGQTILCGLDLTSMKWMKIVGVVRDVHMDGPAKAPGAEIYMPYLQHPRQNARVIVRAGENPLSLAAAVRRKVRTMNPEASLKLSTMENHLATVVSTPRFSSELISVFAGLAMLLAVIGIYAVLAYAVTQRTAEIGLRVALGAPREQILRMVLGQALKLTGIGIVVGGFGAIAVTRLLQSQLFHVSTEDPATYLTMIALLTSVALAASYLPAWRASRIEPLKALREE
ncbi:MAG TPA: ABC transporter permease [Bryobacteraceae bacterium]